MRGHFTEDRSESQKELQRHCEEVYTDKEQTKEEQENRTEYSKKKGNQQFTEEGRNAEITADLVLQPRAKLSDNKVNGPEDAIVSEMIKRLPNGKDLHNCELRLERKFILSRDVFRNDFWSDGVSKLVQGGETGVLEEAGCSPD